MPLHSISKIADITGLDRRTIRRRLSDLTPTKKGRALLFDTRDALQLLYGSQADGDLDPQQERAALDRSRRESQELKNAEAKGELLRAEDVVLLGSAMVGAARAKILGTCLSG